MIVRVQSSCGMKKIEVLDDETLGSFSDKVALQYNLPKKGSWQLSTSRKVSDKIKSPRYTRLSKLDVKHGDIVYLLGDLPVVNQSAPGDVCDISNPDDMDLSSPSVTDGRVVVEDAIDQELSKMDGRIKRKRNEQLCHHPPSGKCIHCVPLEPFDSEYLQLLDPPVKFMSFHAYLRKLSGSQGKNKLLTLEKPSYRVRSGCHSHPPWPEGICTKCQPNPVTLGIQPYRHVDFLQFENGQMMETFLEYWRKSGNQRIGILLGRYAHFHNASAPPLAIKAVVMAIYEPPQESTYRSAKLTVPLDSVLPAHVMEVVERLGLVAVGWIFTDLVAEHRPGRGTVKHYRGTVDTFFLSAEECVTAAHFQNLYPNICTHSPDGRFGSKFVTVVVTGDASNEIHFDVYQVTNQAMALENANIFIPTHDAPEFGYVRETTKEQFVPEVFYSLKDEYGNPLTKIARPLPVEYLLVYMPAAFPMQPIYTMAKLPEDLQPSNRFPVANREAIGQLQDVPAFARLYNQLGPQKLYSCLANFHILCWLAANDTLPLAITAGTKTDAQGLVGLLDAIAEVNRQTVASSSNERAACGESAVQRWAKESSAWATVQELCNTLSGDIGSQPTIKHSGLSGGPSNSGTASISTAGVSTGDLAAAATYWACTHCTFHNPPQTTECEMCGLPQHG